MAREGPGLLLPAFLAIAADFRARRGDVDAAIFLNLLFQLFIKLRLELTHSAAFEAGNMDVIARAVTLVEVLIATQVEQVEFIDEPVAFEQVDGPVDRDAVNVRVEPLRTLENRPGVEMLLGAIHDLEQNFALACQAHAALFERLLQAPGAFVSVDSLSRRDSMCCRGHDSV